MRYIDAPVVRFHDSDTDGNYLDAEDNILYYTIDANFNVTALVDAETGEVVERYMYDPYGKVKVLNGESGYDADGQVTEWSVDTGGSDWANEILYCGYHFDAETGPYQVRHRHYHPTPGRWTTRETHPYADSMTLVAFGGCNPANGLDPSGMEVLISGRDNLVALVNGRPERKDSWQFRLSVQRYLEDLCPCYEYTFAPVTIGGAPWIKVGLAEHPLKPAGSDALCQCLKEHKKGCSLVEDAIKKPRKYFIRYAQGKFNATPFGNYADINIDPWKQPTYRPWFRFPDGTEKPDWLVPDAALFGHEMIHAYYPRGSSLLQMGTEQVMIGGKSIVLGNQTFEEFATVGSPLYVLDMMQRSWWNKDPNNDDITENMLRGELGLPIRLTYGSDYKH